MIGRGGMAMHKVILYFDPSRTGAGALVSIDDARVTMVMTYKQFTFGTPLGDTVLGYLFGLARQHGAAVAAEEPQGTDARGRAIRRAQAEIIGELKARARQCELPWAGVVAPGTAKVALTGRGTASKREMIRMANLRFRLLLRDPEDEHIADAIGGALAALEGRFMQRHPRQRRAIISREMLRRAALKE